ncbi:MAG: hypothetical protein ABEL97_09635, partial [Salinibacter sp.]
GGPSLTCAETVFMHFFTDRYAPSSIAPEDKILSRVRTGVAGTGKPARPYVQGISQPSRKDPSTFKVRPGEDTEAFVPETAVAPGLWAASVHLSPFSGQAQLRVPWAFLAKTEGYQLGFEVTRKVLDEIGEGALGIPNLKSWLPPVSEALSEENLDLREVYRQWARDYMYEGQVAGDLAECKPHPDIGPKKATPPGHRSKQEAEAISGRSDAVRPRMGQEQKERRANWRREVGEQHAVYEAYVGGWEGCVSNDDAARARTYPNTTVPLVAGDDTIYLLVYSAIPSERATIGSTQGGTKGRRRLWARVYAISGRLHIYSVAHETERRKLLPTSVLMFRWAYTADADRSCSPSEVVNGPSQVPDLCSRPGTAAALSDGDTSPFLRSSSPPWG